MSFFLTQKVFISVSFSLLPFTTRNTHKNLKKQKPLISNDQKKLSRVLL